MRNFQVRPSMTGVPGMGMLGSLGSGAQMRPGAIPAHHQQRPVQSSLRPVSSASTQLPSSQVSSFIFLRSFFFFSKFFGIECKVIYGLISRWMRLLDKIFLV